MKKFDYEEYIPRFYTKNEAVLDLQWASNLSWFRDNERAWKILTRIVRFIVKDGDDPGPPPTSEPPAVKPSVEVYIVYPPVKEYRSHVFQQAK